MVLGRKFTIWLVSFAIVLMVFLMYRSTSSTRIIEITRLDQGAGQADANQFIADSNAGQVGQAKLEYLERARFETVDVKTRKLKRVVGFEKVLHKSGNEWILDKPYMNVFQDKLRCDITADTGTVELENVEGANPAPKSAVLSGNVVVHILPETTASPSDSFVHLNQVTFDSDRSMFFSDDDVNYISADAHLVGKGLEIVYNSITNRLEYLKVKQVDFLNVMSFAKTNRAKGKNSQITPVKTSSNEPPQSPQPSQPSHLSEPAKAAESAQASVKEKSDKESYQCLFRDNAVLEYEKEVILADEIAITNLLWSSSEKQQEKPTAVDKTADKTSDKTADQNTHQLAPVQQHDTATASLNEQKPVIATVKCDGPMIIKAVSAAGFDDFKPAEFRKFHDLPDKTFSWLGKRNVLLSQRVSYDYTNQIAKADGKVELVFYPVEKSRSNRSNRSNEPFIIDAQKGAEFMSKLNRAIFYGNVKGSFNKQTDNYNEKNTFYGDRLIVDLTSAKDKSQSAYSSDVAHITVAGPGVRLESVRTLGETKLSHVRLKSEKIDYDKTTEDIIATGKGIIEYGNISADNFKTSSSKAVLDRPCYALVEGFDKLVWDTNSLQVKAFSEKSKGVHIGYLPVEKDGYGRKITIDTRQVDIDYFEPIKGKAQLKQLNAAGGIVYYEQDRYEFVGRDLHYDAQEDFLTVAGAEDMPCMLNGVFADAIEYDLKTGSAIAVLSSGVGIMPVKE